MGLELALGIFMLLAGVYLLVAGIRGKGGVYENTNIKEGQERKYKRIVRISCLVISPFLIAMFTFALLKYCVQTNILWATLNIADKEQLINTFNMYGKISLWTSLIGLGAMISITMKLSDKHAAQPKEIKSAKHPAFDFDDEDEDNKG